ncbi:MAG TPA: response regulator, partial [Candidatus Paceibacterota bacterium]|nr:response regulator [Candidatus Paceibacterota bacterium]
MPTSSDKQKRFLFVDDDAGFLTGIEKLFREFSGGSWEVFTAQNHARALAFLRDQRVDVVVLDIGMPVMDGLEFLRLLRRTHPGLQVVMLTGLATEQGRKASLEAGAVLFLEKPATAPGYREIFAALDALADASPQEGFRGIMRRVGLQDVLQMECLGRKSSVLEVFTGKARGRIFIRDGEILHAETGSLQGELALYSLLGLRGGEFNLLPFSPPPERTITGQYEFLLMEAARLSDEQTGQ